METGLGGKGVLVTGASGGIGAACARGFAREGARVVLHYYRGRERAEAVAAELGDAAAGILNADLTVEEDVAALFEGAVAALGHVDVCAAFLTARAFLREVERNGNGHGSLVLVGSTDGLFGEAGHADWGCRGAGRGARLGRALGQVTGQLVVVAGSMEGRVVHDDPAAYSRRLGRLGFRAREDGRENRSGAAARPRFRVSTWENHCPGGPAASGRRKLFGPRPPPHRGR